MKYCTSLHGSCTRLRAALPADVRTPSLTARDQNDCSMGVQKNH